MKRPPVIMVMGTSVGRIQNTTHFLCEQMGWWWLVMEKANGGADVGHFSWESYSEFRTEFPPRQKVHTWLRYKKEEVRWERENVK